MCLTVTSSVIRIAKKDIVCYKYLDQISKSSFRSCFKGFGYKKGKLYTRKNFPKSVQIYDFLASGGFHSYRFKKDSIYFGRTTVRCIIPKGSKYICGKQCDYKQYFSESIIIQEVIK